MSPFSLKILIVEDNLAFALQLEMLLQKLGYFVCGRVDNAIDGLRKIYKEHPDLILMDIDLRGDMTGLEVSQKIVDLHIPILFITSYKDEATYSLAESSNMIGYLVKPVNKFSLKSGIQLAISKAYALKQEGEKATQLNVEEHIVTKHSFFFKKKDILYKVLTKDIAYIEAADNYSKTVTIQGNSFTARLALSKLETMLPPSVFIRTHRQYIVQVAHIEQVNLESNTILIQEKEIPLSRNKRKELKEVMNLIT